MAVKYQILFKDVDGNDCKVTFDFAGWVGPVYNVLAGEDPVTISYQGDRDNLFQQIVTSQAIIHCVAQPNFVRDTRDIDDREVFVTITAPAGKWIGYLITYQRSEQFDSAGYELEMIAKDPFSYLKDSEGVLSTTSVLGFKNLSDIISTIMGIPVACDANWLPVNGGTVVTGKFLENVYCKVETFMSDGIMPSGYDVISKICDTFNLTASVVDGIVRLRQARKIMASSTKDIGASEKYKDFLIGDEELTRTKSIVQLGVKHDYGEIGGALISNNFFYYINPSKPIGQEVTEWGYLTEYSQFSITQPKIKKADNKGIIINGLCTDSIITAAFADTNSPAYLWTQSEFVAGGGIFHFKMKYVYDVYDKTQTNPQLWYIFHIYAIFEDGTVWAAPFKDNDGGRGKYNGKWQKVDDVYFNSSDPNNNTPYFYLTYTAIPLASSKNEQEFEFSLATDNVSEFPYSKGNFRFMMALWPMRNGSYNKDFWDDHSGSKQSQSIPRSINITEIGIYPNVFKMGEGNPKDPYQDNDHTIMTADETNIRSNRKFKEVADTLELSLGVKYLVGNTFFNPSATWLPDGSFGVLNGTLYFNDKTSIEKFDSNGTQDKLVTLNARDRMYFLRQPRNQITVDIRSSNLKFSDILSFPGFIEGKYVQMESEYRVAECEHTVTVQELKGSDEETDIIENYLSSE